MRNDGVLDPDNPRHIVAISRLLSTRLVHGANSEEYRRQLSDFEEYRRTLRGDIAPVSAPAKDAGAPAGVKQGRDTSCAAGSPNRNEADRLWREVLTLEKGGNFTSARKTLQRSLAICADPKRAAYDKILNDKWMNDWARKVSAGVRKAIPQVKEVTTTVTNPRR